MELPPLGSGHSFLWEWIWEGCMFSNTGLQDRPGKQVDPEKISNPAVYSGKGA